jgi:carboxyl-terminal processing protease
VTVVRSVPSRKENKVRNLLTAVWVSAIAVCLLAARVSAQTLPLEERMFILGKTYASLPLQFAHWRDASFKPSELDSVYRSFLRRGIATENRREFALLMREFIALLNNTHSWYSDDKVFGQALPMGFLWTNLGNRWIVTESAVAGLQRGDLVLAIDGKTPDEWCHDLSKYLTGSNERTRKISLFSILAVTLPEEYSLRYQGRDGSSKTVTVNRTAAERLGAQGHTEGRWLVEGRIGYIKIPSFNSPEFQNDALEFLEQFKDARALIVDVRGNPGGSTPSRLTAALMDRPFYWWVESTPLTLGLFRYYSEVRPDMDLNEYFRYAQLLWWGEASYPDSGSYTGNVIILTDGSTGSAAEDFTVPFKDNGRALIIGGTTNGSTGQPYFYHFGDGISIGIGTKRAYMPNGAVFEGIGIQPDIRVEPEREDFYTGTDRVLDRALAEAEKLIDRQ